MFTNKSWSLALLFAVMLFFDVQDLSAVDYEVASGGGINGYVKDANNGETIIGATVFVKGTSKGAYTNKSGYYNIQGLEDGAYEIRVSSVGFQAKELTVNILNSKQVRLDIELETGDVATDEIVVQSEREVEKRQITVSKVNIPIEQIKEIRIGGESDVFRSIQMLPGVLTSSQISSGLFIRGGSPDQNLVLLDGSTVYNPSHLFGFISAFNSEAIKDVELIKGGYPAEYGSRLSAVLNITQKDGNRKEVDGLASIGLISSKASVEGPLGNGSFFIGGRRTYFDALLAIIPEDEESPFPDFGFYDLNAKVTQNIGKNDKISISGFMSRDDFRLDDTGFDIRFFIGNTNAALNWTHLFGANMFSKVNLTYSRYNNGFENDLSGFDIAVGNTITDITLKNDYEWFASEKLTMKGGYEISNFIFEYDQNFTGDEDASGENEGGLFYLKVPDWTYAGYTQANYQITDLISLQGGLRVNWWDFSENLTFDPRLAARWQIQDNFAIKGSWGIFHQYLRLAGDDVITLFDTWLPTDRTVDPSQATHYILSFETNPFEGYDLNFDVYYKDLKNISELRNTNIEGDDVADVFFNGNGEAYGFEVFLQKKFGRFSGWLGYAWGMVNARFDSVNFGNEYHPRYDRRHDFKVVGRYELNEKWLLSGTFMFQSGQPYTGATSRYQTRRPYQNYGASNIIQSERFGLRLPPSHQLNLSATYKTSFFKLPANLIFDIYNVYSRRDILFRFYNTNEPETVVEDVRLLPIIPTVSYEVRF